MIKYPEINKVFLKIGPLEFRWYGLSYAAGIILGLYFIKNRLKKQHGFTSDQVYSLINYVIIGILAGGRLAYILIYDLRYYIKNPSKIIYFWQGGMSYHGAAIGVLAAVAYLCYKNKKNLLGVLDLIAIGSTFGLFLGRIANFINGELYGRASSVPWAMVFPDSDGIPRHPSQLYEGFFEGVVLFLLLFTLMKYCRLKQGQLFALYMFFYGLFRFFIEFYREPDKQLGSIVSFITMGQLLCTVMILSGLILFIIIRKYRPDNSPAV
ncbi:MAG: prolipoprotein diacylglyceryl transferase [bacterium]|nr:prolipoprotein diacylglyceryl transferase [bacterium]